jgi:acetoin utilization deacetylase AcuC-like enzyme
MIGITYHKDYNKYDLGLRHPLVGNKPKNTINFLKEKKILNEIELFHPKKATEEDILRVHDLKFLDQIKDLSKTGGMIATDTPAPKGIYEIASLATGGTIMCGEKLFNDFNVMVNPLAGFHHACKSFTSGFCFFNDIAIVVEFLREKHNLERFLIVDLDVHHANGTQEIFYTDPTVLNISFHQDGRTLYPGTGFIDKIGKDKGEGYTINLPLPPKTGSKSYLEAFDRIIPIVSKQFNPQVIIYQSGVDTHHSDPLADLNLVYQTYFHLGKNMKKVSDDTCNKLLVLFGGGYNSDASIKSYYNIMCGIMNKKSYIKEKEIPDLNYDLVVNSINELTEKLQNYWDF